MTNKHMKTKILALSALLMISWGCNKNDLNLVNPNAPSNTSLVTPGGVVNYALGIYEKLVGYQNPVIDPSDGATSAFTIAIGVQGMMGDDMFCPYGNFGMRWTEQITSIKLPAAYGGTVILGSNKTTLSQKDQLQSTNTRAAQGNNAFQYEWTAMYLTLGQVNNLLNILNTTKIAISDTQKQTLLAWCYWWRGFCYSRIGSLYLSGVIVDTFGQTTGDYKDRTEIIVEANANFDKAIAILQTLTSGGDYDVTMKAIVPTFSQNNLVVAPDSWVRMINTYKARNLLVNKKITDMQAADWNNVISLANIGLKSTDNIFWWGQTADGLRDFSNSFFHPYNMNSYNNGFWFSSERTIQEYDPTDKRLGNYDTWENLNFEDPGSNILNRGYLFGTRYMYTYIEDGGSFSSGVNKGFWPISPTYEENELMKAEAYIRLNNGSDNIGLGFVDAVRNFQNAGLAPVAGTGLIHTDAIEQLRRERRCALTLRGLAFYDARRWGITQSVANGGGRANGMVRLPATLLGGTASDPDQVIPCLIDYNFMDYWDIPANELDFNVPTSGASIKN